MKFVGGFMHGFDVPEGIVAFQNRMTGEIVMRVIDIRVPEEVFYIATEWYCGPDRPLVKCMVVSDYAVLDSDHFYAEARALLC